MLNLKATRKELKLIEKIADRIVRNYEFLSMVNSSFGFHRSKADFELDIILTHLNGCKLDLRKFLEFPNFDFFHDVWGIAKNLNPITGKLDNFFLPRCAANVKAV